jgi:integrase/recombinase XerD
MYEAGVRVSELVNLKLEDFHMEQPYYLKVIGKGKKERNTPLSRKVIIKVRNYIKVNNGNVSQKMFLCSLTIKMSHFLDKQ